MKHTHMMVVRLLFVSLFFLASNNIFCQENRITKKVLMKNQVGKVYCFDSSSKENGLNKIFIRYIGKVKTNNGIEYKIVTWSRVWGINHHTTGIVYVYDSNNNYIGKYVLGDSSDLPDKIVNGNLTFTNKHKQDCDANLVTSIDFSRGIPKDIFLKCKGDSGDIYSFSTEE